MRRCTFSIPFLCPGVAGGQSQKVNTIDGMSQMLTDFYRELFEVSAGEPLPLWINSSWGLEDLRVLPVLSGALVRRELMQMGRKKTCANDHLVAEMLMDLDDDVMALFAQLFRDRLLNVGSCGGDEAWGEHVVRLLRKKGFQHRVRDFRPIALLPTMYKVYSRVLLALAGSTIDRFDAPQFAFRKHHQAHEVVYILRSLVEKGN